VNRALPLLASLVVAGIAGPVRGEPSGGATAAVSRFSLTVEGGAVWQSRNDVEIPNDGSATRFDAVELLGNGPWPAFRVTAVWNVNERHALRAVAAPLSVTGTGMPEEDLVFEGVTFPAGRSTDVLYRFDSWRLGYRWAFDRTGSLTAGLGFTAKIRDAEVELEQADRRAAKTNVGFVPLLRIDGTWHFAPRTELLLELEGLAGGPGRAFDLSASVRREVGTNLVAGLGYRTIEGGADVGEVYNFAWLHYLVASVEYRP
jgi:hypothetical protein